MYTQIGTCPQCGAPIWASMMNGSILPPQPIYSCICHSVQQKTVIYKTTNQGKSENIFKTNIPAIGEMYQKLMDNTNIQYIRNPLTY